MPGRPEERISMLEAGRAIRSPQGEGWCPGVEPKRQNEKEVGDVGVARRAEVTHPCSSPRNLGLAGEDAAKVVLAWAKLPESIRAAILALVDAAKGDPP
jgi:hypothetical protein